MTPLYLLLILLGAIFARPIIKAVAFLCVMALGALGFVLLWRVAGVLQPSIIAGIIVGVLITIFGSGLHINYLVQQDLDRAIERARGDAEKRRVRWF